MMAMDFSFLLRNLAFSVPSFLACSVGLVMVSMFRQRSQTAANTAMWCLIAILVETALGTIATGLIPLLANRGGGGNLSLMFGVVGLLRQIIFGAALLGLVYSVFQDREHEADALPELESSE